MLAGVMIFVDVSIVNVALPSFTTGLGAGPADLSWIVAGYTLTFGLALVPGGRLGDQRGRRRMVIVGLVLLQQTAQRIGSSLGIAVVETVFFTMLASSGQQFGTALAAGLAVVLLCVLAAFALGLADMLRRRRGRSATPPIGDVGTGVLSGTGTDLGPHATVPGHPHH